MKCGGYWLVLIGLTLALTACGEERPAEVPLPVLVSQQAEYQNALVATQGVVRSFDNPRHYWIEDEDLNRVEILPQEQIAPYLGQEVRVVGRFGLDNGRKLTLERLETVDDSP
ncbi:glucose-inhibited division protein B [Pistricoccus aurantiacus]|uniref:Glucose-inhibited division protein B n=1 Tax=Pistricoccus aurantiacus TaxID=1883414 RepID=A0A5B8SKY2_9GAMM|nr:hypothetical protein [Pistricoccus aurantiacus]QEA37762.1 glucose-inhibited division protein B [Pistricoccus aurantiacus]